MLKRGELMKRVIKTAACFIFAVLFAFCFLSKIAFANEHEHSFGEWQKEDGDVMFRLCSCGEKETFHRFYLPASYSGTLYVENNPGGFYCGTQNAADVLGIKEGTFSNGELTVTVEGTEITVSGTPSKTVYYDLQTGEFKVPDYTRTLGYTLPNGNYRFTFNGSGSYMPTVCIRNPDGNGNFMAISQNAKTETKYNVKTEDFGIPYLYFPKNITYDYSGNLVLTIGASSVYDNQISNVNFIESEGTFSVDGYLWSAKENPDIFGNLEQEQNRYNKIVYNGGTSPTISIFLPQSAGLLEIQMNLADSETKNAFGWRLSMMYACDNEYKRVFPITNSGEYEMAIKLNGRPDFIGMGAHGSERMTSFSIFIDNIKTDPDEISSFTNWENLRIIRESDMYDPADETTIVGKHFVEYVFDTAGLTVNQSVEWLVDDSCSISYMMMFPVRRKHNDLQITDTFYDNYDPLQYNVSEEGFTGYPPQWTYGATKMTLFSEKSGITAVMESLSSTQLPGVGYKHCSNSASYNKLYFTICGARNIECPVKIGDIWNTSTRYEVVIENGTEINRPLSGDINCDYKINVIDANLIRRYSAKLAALDEKQLAAADVSGDGNVNVLDANLIRRYAAKLIDSFPAENH